MATDPRDPRFLDILRQLGNDDQVMGGRTPAALSPLQDDVWAMIGFPKHHHLRFRIRK